MSRVVVIGGGYGGLACAARLAKTSGVVRLSVGDAAVSGALPECAAGANAMAATNIAARRTVPRILP